MAMASMAAAAVAVVVRARGAVSARRPSERTPHPFGENSLPAPHEPPQDRAAFWSCGTWWLPPYRSHFFRRKTRFKIRPLPPADIRPKEG